MTPLQALEKAIELAGSQTELAKKVGGKVRQQHVSHWLKAGQVSPGHARAVANATAGEVTVHQLRPDIFGPAGRPADEQTDCAQPIA